MLDVMYVARFQTSLANSMPMIAGVCHPLVCGTIVLGTVLNAPAVELRFWRCCR